MGRSRYRLWWPRRDRFVVEALIPRRVCDGGVTRVAVSESEEREREEQGARTQSLFRDVNERVREVNETFGEVVPLAGVSPPGDWLCARMAPARNGLP